MSNLIGLSKTNPIKITLPKGDTDGIFTKSEGKTNNALKTEYEKMISSGYDNIIYLESSNALGNDFEGTVDAVHFTDLGFKRYSNFLIEKFKEYDLLND